MLPGMITFRCWYCNRRHTVGGGRVGERMTCKCERLLCVPERNGGKCRVKTLVDWVVETVVYGFGGAFLGFGLALLSLIPFHRGWRGGVGLGFSSEFWCLEGAWVLLLTLVGFVIGLFGGERGINWIGQKIRDWEES